MVEQLAAEFSITEVCNALGVRRSAYYEYRQRTPGTRQQEDERLGQKVANIFRQHKRRYGARRIAQDLKQGGEVCGRRRVAKLLHQRGLQAIQPRSFQPKTTCSRHRLGYNDNLLKSAKTPQKCDEIWVGDITYLPLTAGGFAYLAVLMDLFSRRIVGWCCADHMREELTLATLRSAIRIRQPGPQLIHHTDRGGQYAGHAYRGVLGRAAMQQSMSDADNCYDNAFMESCFGTIKRELGEKMQSDVSSWIKEISVYVRYYNDQRRHSSLGYLTPVEFERQFFCSRQGK